MSGVPSNLPQMPFLPEEVMLNIFLCLDAATILACRSTCHYWQNKLSSYEFLVEVSRRLLARGSHLFVHFGYSITEELSVDWITKMDPVMGEVFAFQFPFTLNPEGWFHIIGVQNGLFCVRFSEDGGASSIIVWNPATSQIRAMDDPLQQHYTDCVYHYALSFFPASVDYAILHISGHHEENAHPTLKIFFDYFCESLPKKGSKVTNKSYKKNKHRRQLQHLVNIMPNCRDSYRTPKQP
ncbi:hypothetical protein PIB30_049990 [Stylosanthes scabra]|uniref:F-box domain-containing protein n=1 Tax=Stylosanthes scabra TaxID=79078 RepID=A0ABU6RHJ1_9FABA|nr:hypothetical protein [Stylosanthes scabra]